MADAFTLTLAADHVTPVRAYAALRSHAPQQSSFLLESLAPGERWSIVGYRAMGESLYPPGAKAFSQILEAMTPDPTAPQGLAEQLSQATFGYVAYEAVHPLHAVEPWEHQGSLSRMMKGVTLALFDHQLHTVTLAGPSRGSVKRAAWEMTHGPELQQLPVPDPAAFPEYIDALVEDAAFEARLARAQRYVESGEVEQVVLARSFLTAMRNAEPFDVYRALRLLAPAAYLYFVDFVGTPFAPGMILAGGAAVPTVIHEAGDVAAVTPITSVTPEAAFKAAFPAAVGTGTPQPRALQIVRELEHGARGVFGGAVGYILPNGSLAMAAPLRTLSFQDGQVEIGASTVIRPGSEGDSTRSDAQPAFAAVRAAQDAATEREKAEEIRRARIAAKEQAEREQAEREQAEKSGPGSPEGNG